MGRASIIIVVWNGEPYLRDCLEAVLSQQGPEDEVIVVDNASSDHSVKLVRESFPQVRLIENHRNLGFAGGANVGIRASASRFCVLLNQDVVVLPGWLEALLETLHLPEVGVAGCKLLYPDGRIQHAGGLIRWPLGLPDHFGYGQPDDGQWDGLREVDYVTGAAWGLRREVVEQIGLLDEEFWPGYYEEVDYCFRAREAGWRVMYNSKSVGVHKESSSLGKGSKIYLEAMQRGRLRFVLKHTPLVRLNEEFFPAEERMLRNSPVETCRTLARAYLMTLLSVPRILEGKEGRELIKIIAGFTYLRSLALSLMLEGGTCMSNQDIIRQLPALEDFKFPSRVPVVGPVISFVRRLLYNMTAKWGVWAVIQQQNRINQILAEWLHHQNQMIIDIDQDLTFLARTVAEIEVRQRYLLQMFQLQQKENPTEPED